MASSSPHEEAEIVAGINAAAPDILWVGMGVPLQERFALNNREKLTNVGLLKDMRRLFSAI